MRRAAINASCLHDPLEILPMSSGSLASALRRPFYMGRFSRRLTGNFTLRLPKAWGSSEPACWMVLPLGFCEGEPQGNSLLLQPATARYMKWVFERLAPNPDAIPTEDAVVRLLETHAQALGLDPQVCTSRICSPPEYSFSLTSAQVKWLRADRDLIICGELERGRIWNPQDWSELERRVASRPPT